MSGVAASAQADTGEPAARAAAPAPRAGRWREGLRRIGKTLRPVRRFISKRLSSSLTRRIVVLNLGGLVALLAGFLYLNQFREGLIDARVQSLRTQGEMIAAAVAASATVETDTLTIDPEKLLQLAPGESFGPAEDAASPYEFSINPERIGPVLRRLVSPTRTIARIYDSEGVLVIDSRSLSVRGTILRSNLPAPGAGDSTLLQRTWDDVRRRFTSSQQATTAYEDFSNGNGKGFPEVALALTGGTESIVRVNGRGQTIVSVAVPIQRLRVVRGALLMSTQGGDIDRIIASERWAILRIFLVAVSVMFLLSLFLAGTIAEPVRKLAEAAERVRRGIKSRQEIPDFTGRSDEIGHLSGALRDMTKALYNRIEAIESFAADVAHELKNPLTSLRSAVETLPRVRNDEARGRLLAVIQHDVRRLDRLISDISDASRLDAELARADVARVDLAALLQAVVGLANQVRSEDGVRISLRTKSGECFVQGHDSRLAQVITNLLDNARSFSPDGGEVRVTLAQAQNAGGRDGFEIIVDDDGSGIPAHAFERIFERFYTDRPTQHFGQNSGLGLSISRQIVAAHGGTIEAANRAPAKTGRSDAVAGGARFTVWLPKSA